MGANFANDRGVRPMHMACQSGDMALVQRLLELGKTSRRRVIDEGGVNNNAICYGESGSSVLIAYVREYGSILVPTAVRLDRMYNVCYLDQVVFRLKIPFVKYYKTYGHLYQQVRISSQLTRPGILRCTTLPRVDIWRWSRCWSDRG